VAGQFLNHLPVPVRAQKARGSITRRTLRRIRPQSTSGLALQTVRRSARRPSERAHKLPLGIFGRTRRPPGVVRYNTLSVTNGHANVADKMLSPDDIEPYLDTSELFPSFGLRMRES